MKLRTEVGLGPGIVLGGEPAAPPQNGSPCVIGPLSCLFVCPACDVGVLWPDGSMDQDETSHAGRP